VVTSCSNCRLSFDDAKTNFLSAARCGLQARFHWIDGKMPPELAEQRQDYFARLERQNLE